MFNHYTHLALVDVVIRMDRFLCTHFASEQFDAAIGNHLIEIHVGLGARACLPHHQREVFIQLAIEHLSKTNIAHSHLFLSSIELPLESLQIIFQSCQVGGENLNKISIYELI